MADAGHDETEKLIAQLEKKIAREYAQASKEAREKLDDYLRRFAIKDEKWRLMVARGDKTPEEYAAWREAQIMTGKRWEALKDQLAADYHNANTIARSIVNGYMPEAYAINHNFATYQIEHDGHVDTSYTLYSRESVERIIREEPELLPPPGRQMQARIAAGKDIAWQKGQIQSVCLQAILQGESIPHISQRIATTMGESNHKSTIRYARTAMTGAQNAGRQDAYHRAEALGVKMQRQWIATLDNRTRHEHRQLDGQRRGIDEPFEADGYKIMYPGDPSAAGVMIWNCRCTLRAEVKGWESKSGALRSDETIKGQSYEQWSDGHSQPERITKQEEIAEIMRRKYIRELYKGNPDGGGTSKQPTVQKPPTIAGVERGAPMTHREADTGRVNPNFAKGGGYHINCQSCVATYEARLRGYDVEVVSNDKQHPMCGKLAIDTRLIWLDSDGKTPEYDIGSKKWTYKGDWRGAAPTAKKFEQILKDNLDVNGRYTLNFKWRGFNAGHIVNIENDAGTLVIYDPQSDKTLRGAQVSEYLAKMQYKRQFRGNTYYQYPGVMRVDDKEINFDVANQIMQKRE